MLTFTSGDLFDSDAEALVNAVNTVGVAGKGIALRFRQAYPANFAAYARACRRGEVVPGKMFVYQDEHSDSRRYIINFPTKRHWRSRSRLADIEAGLEDFVRVLGELEISSVAIPALGCGHGGLDWNTVSPLIEGAMTRLPEVHAIVYLPKEVPALSR